MWCSIYYTFQRIIQYIQLRRQSTTRIVEWIVVNDDRQVSVVHLKVYSDCMVRHFKVTCIIMSLHDTPVAKVISMLGSINLELKIYPQKMNKL